MYTCLGCLYQAVEWVILDRRAGYTTLLCVCVYLHVHCPPFPSPSILPSLLPLPPYSFTPSLPFTFHPSSSLLAIRQTLPLDRVFTIFQWTYGGGEGHKGPLLTIATDGLTLPPNLPHPISSKQLSCTHKTCTISPACVKHGYGLADIVLFIVAALDVDYKRTKTQTDFEQNRSVI